MITKGSTRPVSCPTCGQPLDPRSDLCLACLMGCAEMIEPLAFDEAEDSAAEPLRVGTYELLEEIGRGGMGVIYRARQLRTDRCVAMKVLQSHIAHRPEMLARFRREAEAAARLDHPHVLPIYEVNEEADGAPFFTMKLATGGSLIERRAAFTGRFREVAAIIAKVARAVQHAHERGVLHRDLKPGNILFDAHGEPMVGDFGLAAWLHEESDLTRTIMVFGTPGYLPPEFINGRPEVLTPASDLYSLGVILFELLAGQLPGPAAASLAGVREAACRPARLRSITPAAPRDLEVVCERCLEPEPNLRYASASALAGDLERWLRGEPIMARPTPLVVRGWKFALRHAAMVGITALCLVLAVTGVTVNHFRQKTMDTLTKATAYDRTVCLLPVEDLDALTTDSPLAREAAGQCAASARTAPGLIVIGAPRAPDPLPRDGDLIGYGRSLGARYLLSATVRRRAQSKRLVVHVIDAARNDAAPPLVMESATPDGEFEIPALAALLRSFCEPKGRTEDHMHPDQRDAAAIEADKYVRTGDQLLRRGTLAEVNLALDAYRKALQAVPGDPDALAGLAVAMSRRSTFGQAETWISQAEATAALAAQAAPHQAGSARAASRASAMRGNAASAREHGLIAFELDPADPQSASAVATAYEVEGALDLALLWIERARRRDPAPGAYAMHRGDYLLEVGEYALAARAYREDIEFHPGLPHAPLALASLHLLEGNAPLALETVRSLHRTFPEEPVVAQTRAAIEFQVGDPAVAEKIYAEFVQDSYGGLTAYLGVRAASAMGCLALARGDPGGRARIEQALALDRQQLQAEPEDDTLLHEVAANLALLGRDAEALETLRACSIPKIGRAHV